MGAAEVVSIIAVAGALMGAFGGAWLQSRLTSRREMAGDLRERRMALYVDVAVYAHYRHRHLSWLLGDAQYKYMHDLPSIVLQDTDLLTARMQLLANEEVRVAWRGILAAWTDLSEWLDEVQPVDESRKPTAPPDHRYVVALSKAIEQLQGTIRHAAVRRT